MTNEELIATLRYCFEKRKMVAGVPLHVWCDRAADALEAADEMIDDCVAAIDALDDSNDAYIKENERLKKRIAELEAQILKIKSRIYDLESMAKREYDDDPDNEYLEGYFDGLHQAAKLISTTSMIEKGEKDE